MRLPLPLSWRSTWRRTSSRETTYLAYDDKAAEHDLIDLAQRLTRGYVEHVPTWRRWLRHVEGRHVRLKLLFVFDELDKLDEGRNASERPALDRVLGTLKNLFTTSGISFVFVAGKDLHDRWVEDLSKGDSIYESVFAHAQYLPGLWEDAERLADALLGDVLSGASGGSPAGAYSAFRKYLAFRGRGIPRRIVRGFNEFVRWDGSAPHLGFDAADIRRFRFYAGLVDTLVAAEEELFGSYRGERSVEQVDKQRLGIYYAIDWIVQREQDSFAFDELLAASRRLSRLIAPVEEAAPGQLQHMIDVLERAEYLERVERRGSTVAGVKIGPGPVRYRLPRRRLLELGAFLGVFEQEAQALFRPPGGPGVVPAVPAWPAVAAAGAPAPSAERYSRTRQLAVGGMSSVHLARDLLTGRDVVIKQLNAHLAADASLRGRAVREGRVLATFTHPGTVKVLDVLDQNDSIAIVMEYVAGPALDEVLKHGPVADMAIANRLMHDILAAVAYVHEQRVTWRDPKPANVLVTPEGRVVLIDFGVARVEGAADTTDVGMVIGTLGYMSPEQLRGEPIGWQSDIFGLGALFYEVLTGRKLFTGTLPEVVKKIQGRASLPRPSDAVAGAAPFDDIVARCLSADPQKRPTASDLLHALPPVLAPADALGTYVSGLRKQEEQREDVGTRPGPSPPTPSAQRTTDPPGWGQGTQEGRAASAAKPPSRAAGLQAVGDGRWFPLSPDGPVTIGRSANNDIVLDDASVSRFAARIRPGTTIVGDGQRTYYIEELNSANGVFVNDTRTFGVTQLHDGDVVSFGSHALRFTGG
jgi:serine/threonine-protein kinase